MGPQVCGWRSSFQDTGGDTVPTKRQRVKAPKVCRAPETGRAADSMRTDKLITPRVTSSARGPQHTLPSSCTTQTTSRKAVAAACRQGLQRDTWWNKGPWGTFGTHPPRRCIGTSLCFAPKGRLLSPLLPPGSYKELVCMSKLRAGSVGIVICYEQQQLDSVSNNSYINKRLTNKYWLWSVSPLTRSPSRDITTV